MRRLFIYIRKYLWHYVIVAILMIFSIALDMFNPRITKLIIDDVIIAKKLYLFKAAALWLIYITVGRAVFRYMYEYLLDLTSSKVTRNLRKDLFDHIQTLSFSYFDGMNTGELMSRIKEDIDHIWNAVSFGIMLTVEQIIYLIVASILLFSISYKLAIVCLLLMPPIGYLAMMLERNIGKVFGKISDQGAIINTTAQESIAGIRLVKAFAREKYEIQKFLTQNKENYNLHVEQASIWAKYHPKIEFLSKIITVIVICVGGFLVIHDEMSIGTMVAFSNYVFMLVWPMRMMGWLTNIMAECSASLKKIDKIFNEQPQIISPANPITPQTVNGSLVFENVCFEYHNTKVLENINIDIAPGKAIAIMGTIGSGKSSIINLIGRYYDCTSGNILLDGINVKDMDLKFLRKQVSVVMQDTFLFSDTIAENIKFGSENATDEEMITAAKDAKIHDFIIQLPDGYNTIIGERGIGLSGGQKQRISIARALLKNSAILILDDATSALDMETEYELQKAIENRKGLTKIIIAHRISAVKNADEIIIIEDGRIVERGTHHQLLQLKGIYYKTYCLQFQGMFDINGEEVVV